MAFADYCRCSGYCAWFKDLSDKHSFVSIESSVFQSPQAIWAELLTGNDWLSNGIYGYGTVEKSIADVQVTNEHHLRLQTPISDKNDKDWRLLANVPLTLPAQNRIWLSDGTTPVAADANTIRLLSGLGINKYSPRACFSANYLGSAQELELLFAHELERLKICLQAIRQFKCSLSIIRISAFDIMFHAFGTDFLESNLFRYQPIWLDFLGQLSQMLSELEALIGVDNIAVFSTHNHVPCLGLLDINQLLYRSGFLQATKSCLDEPSVLTRRAAAIQYFRPQSIDADLMPSGYAPETSRAFSPVEATVMINSASRFSHGLLEAEEASALSTVLSELIGEYLSASEIADYRIYNVAGQKDGKRMDSGPDLVISGSGLGFRSANIQTNSFDWTPRTVHGKAGFLLAPPDWTRRNPMSEQVCHTAADIQALHHMLFDAD